MTLQARDRRSVVSWIRWKSWMGLPVILATLALLLGHPTTAAFLVLSMVLGAVVALILYLWHKRHPLT
jgi:hypothetical protein